MATTGYIAYIDEAGDFGLRTVAPIDQNGASEWLVLAAVVARKENEANLIRWLSSARDLARNKQAATLHFRTLTNRQKLIVCEEIAKMPLRCFVVISNKRNMRRYRNESAASVTNHRHWFYMWLVRLLLERVTDFCRHRNEADGTAGKTLKLEFSRRRDLKRNEFTDYFTRLWTQGESPHLSKRTLKWDVFDFHNVHFLDHDSRAGLQLADVVASAFYQAVNINSRGICASEYAAALKPRIHHKDGRYLNEGFTALPTSLKAVELTDEQKALFRLYGFPEKNL